MCKKEPDEHHHWLESIARVLHRAQLHEGVQVLVGTERLRAVHPIALPFLLSLLRRAVHGDEAPVDISLADVARLAVGQVAVGHELRKTSLHQTIFLEPS